MTSNKKVRIGGAAGYWGDTAQGAVQLVRSGNVDYLVFDYLAEVTMSILAKARSKSPELGYATDFVTDILRPLIKEIAAKRIRVIANAGGVNLKACQRAIRKLLDESGVALRIGIVEGDDLLDRAQEFRATGVREMYTSAPFPDKIASINAYLGAFPIAAALDAGADIVITGRVVDSAVTLGPLIHEFGWKPDEYDRLAAGTLAGHLIECGCQVTGGNFTDWERVCDDWDRMGFPIAECEASGEFVITKPEGTGGLVSPETVGEQLLYEIGDPRAYIVPDVVCDFSRATLTQAGPNRVRVADVTGHPPTRTYKVCATYPDGYRATFTQTVTGVAAETKAQKMGAAILSRCRRLYAQNGWPDFRGARVDLIGANALWNPAHITRSAGTLTLIPTEKEILTNFPSPSGRGQGVRAIPDDAGEGAGEAPPSPSLPPLAGEYGPHPHSLSDRNRDSHLLPLSLWERAKGEGPHPHPFSQREKGASRARLARDLVCPEASRGASRHFIHSEPLRAMHALRLTELVMRVSVHHDRWDAIDLFSREAAGSSLSMTTGRCAAGAPGRPKVSPVVRLYSFLWDKDRVPVAVEVDSEAVACFVTIPKESPPRPTLTIAPAVVATGADDVATVPLITLAFARSGDKGDDANIGVIARRPEYLPYLRAELTPARVADWFSHVLHGEVERYDLPGIGALNFVLQNALGDGGVASLNVDTQGKTYAQQLLAMPIKVPGRLLPR